jgi:hypothetical protein
VFFVRAQSSMEMILLVAIGLILLAVTAELIFSNVGVYYSQQQQQIGTQTLSILASEIDDVYFLGPGTTKTIRLEIPEQMDLEGSYIEGKSLVMSINGSEHVRETKVPIRGTWPNATGAYTFKLVSYGDFVAISADLLEFNPSNIAVSIDQGQDTTMDINILNLSPGAIDYTFSVNFNHTNATVTSSDAGVVSFLANDYNDITLNFSCSRSAIGNYDGNLFFDGVDDVSIPIKLFCESGQKRLSIFPSSKDYNLVEQTNGDQTFQVCNSSNTDYSSSTSGINGDVASYAFTSFNGSISANTCRALTLTTYAPATGDQNIYLGTLSVNSGGFAATSDLNLLVTQAVGGGGSGTQNYYFASILNSDLNHFFDYNGFVKQNDNNNWIATGELDWNKEAINTTTSGGWGQLVNDFNIQDGNLIGLWHLNEFSGTTAIDSSGNENNGTWGASLTQTDGLWDTNAGTFNGSDYVDLGNIGTIGVNTSTSYKKTISFWAKGRGFAIHSYRASNSIGDAHIIIYSDGRMRYTIQSNSSSPYAYNAISTITADINNWNHYVVTLDMPRVTGNGAYVVPLTLSINGVTESINLNFTANNAITFNNMYLGRWYNYTWNDIYFNGKIEEVSIWNTTLTTEEIKTLYENQKGQWVDQNLIAYYKFNGSTNDSARGYDGTLANGATIDAKGMWDSNALDLDGDNDYVSTSNGNVIFSDKDSWSTSVWFNGRSSSSYGRRLFTVHRVVGGGSGYTVAIKDDDLVVYISSLGAYNTIMSNISKNKYHHFIGTYDGTTFNAYLDGVLELELTTGMHDFVAEPFIIGNYRSTDTAYGFDGLIDEVKIYGKPLILAEVLADYNSFLSAKFVDNNVIGSAETNDWNQIKINSNEYFSFGKELESTIDGTATWGEINSSNGVWDENLISVWHLNDNLNDSKGSSTGVWDVGGSENYIAGLFDSNVAELDGSTDYINFGDISEIDSTQYLTVSMWIKGDVFSDYDGLFQKYLSGTERFTLQLGLGANNDNPYVTINGAAIYSNQTNFFKANRWKHLVVVYDGSESSNINRIKFYEDGRLVTNVGSIATIPTSLSDLSGGIVRIGNDIHSSGRFFNGLIEEVGVWDKVLTTNEVSNLYSSQSGKFHEPSLVGLWHLNGNTFDSGGNGLNGTWNPSPSHGGGLWGTNGADMTEGTKYFTTPNMELGSVVTACIWLNTTNSANTVDDGIFGKYDTSGKRVWIIYQQITTNHINFIMSNDGLYNAGNLVDSGVTINDGKWHHVCGKHDMDYSYVYVDGVEVASVDTANGLYGTSTPTVNGCIHAADSCLANSRYLGKQEEAIVWNRVLTASEIRELYGKGIASLDLNIYSCSDANCNTRTSSQVITDANNGSFMDLTIDDSRYLGWEAIFGKATGLSDLNAGSFFVNAFVKDVNISYSS